MANVRLTVNGTTYTLTVADPAMPLLWALRDLIGLTGTKFGCGIGLCGACTVHLNGAPARACMTSLSSIGDRAVTTIEGLSSNQSHPLQRAWITEDVSQCGYCQPGQLMAAAALLAQNSAPSDADIDAALSGNLCRCGTYQRIRAAVHQAAGNGGTGAADRADRRS